jgi:ferric-dicitrate binding protein FerR (iron transport regulator)
VGPARDLLDRYLDEIASADEIRELARLLAARPDLADELAEAARTETRLEAHFSERRTLAAVTAVLAAPRRPASRRKPAWRWAAAALVLLGTGILFGFWLGRGTAGPGAVVSGRVLIDGVEVVHVPDDLPLEVGGEEDAVIRLPDGSHAELAPASFAVLRQRGRGRKLVELDRGRGTFHVEKGRNRFRVNTPLGSVSALGADFSVELQPDLDEEEGDDPLNKRSALLMVVAALVGQVEVESGGQHYVLAAGQKKTFADKRKPDFGGTVVAVSAGSLTVESPPPKKGGEAIRKQFKLTDQTKLVYFGVGKEGARPTVGYLASVWLAEGSDDTAAAVRLGLKEMILDGMVAAVAEDGKSFTCKRTLKGGKVAESEIKIAEGAKLVYQDAEKGEKPTPGYFVRIWMKPGTKDVASGIVFSSKKISDAPVKGIKPGKKPTADDQPNLSGTIKALAEDNRSFTLAIPPKKKGGQPSTLEVRIADGTKITDGKEVCKLVAGQAVSVWLEKGSANVARAILVGQAPGKPKPGGEVKKPAPRKKPKEPAKPVRDPGPTAALIDREVDGHLAGVKLPASPAADDAEFLRRVSLDLTGSIPKLARTRAFLDSKDPSRRRKLIDELLDSPAYGEHFATIWRNLIGTELPTKGGRGPFVPWLAEQFNDNRGWNAIVTDLLTVEGPVKDNPTTFFLFANAENFQPRPNRVAGSVARLFWGVNLRCAECHNHPFAHWKQADFWGTAAFFARLRFTGFKGGPATLTEAPATAASVKGKKGQPPAVRGAAIAIPGEAGKGAGKVVKARFLGGQEPALDDNGPFRPRFAAWATAADNPFFARAAVNRLWAHFFGRGFVNPPDGFDESKPPSHPVLLDRLAREFASSGFDLKHLARCITTSKAYQRTSRPVPGNEADKTAFSHMALKVLTPEAFYDSLAVVMARDKNDPTMMAGTKKGKKGGSGLSAREEFARHFRANTKTDPTEYVQGIPQFLRLMNAPLLNRGAPIIERLCNTEASQAEAITTLFFTALSRRPTAEETRLMAGYLSRRKDAREGYSGVLWILLNSSEFALNH